MSLPTSHRPTGASRWVAAVVATALVATLCGCERADRPPPESHAVTTQISLFNATHDVLPLDIRSIHSDYAIDCDLVGANPARYLSDVHLTSRMELTDQFGSPIFSGLEVPITTDRDAAFFGERCHVAFLDLRTDDERLEPLAVSWPRNLDEKTVYYDVDAPAETPPDDHTLVANADMDNVDDADAEARPWRDRPCGGDLNDCSAAAYEDIMEPLDGADYSWSIEGDHPRHTMWDPPSIDDRPVDDPEGDQCRTGRSATPLVWDAPPSGTWRVEAIDEVIVEFGDDDGADEGEELIEWTCHDVTLVDEQQEDSWRFCGSRFLPLRIESPAFDGDVFIEFFTEQRDDVPPSVYEALTIDLERRTDDGMRWEVEAIEAVRGHGVPEHIGLDWEGEAATACEPRRELADDCNQIVIPAHLRVEATGGAIRIEPGQLSALDPGADRRLEHIRGLYRAVSDLRCQDERLGPDHMSHSGPYFEFVYFPGATTVAE